MDLPLWVWLVSIGGLMGLVTPNLAIFAKNPIKVCAVGVGAASSRSAVRVALSLVYSFYPFRSGAAKDAAAPPKLASKRSRKGA